MLIFAQVVPQNDLEKGAVFWPQSELCGSHLTSFLLGERFAPFCVSSRRQWKYTSHKGILS